MSTLEKSWQSYKNEIVPKDASSVQLIETERAFYAGAAELFRITMQSTSTEILDNLKSELIAFAFKTSGGKLNG